MAEGRERSEWARSSVLLALLANAHRDPKKTRAFKPSDFDPFAQRAEAKPNNIPALRAVFSAAAKPSAIAKEDGDGT